MTNNHQTGKPPLFIVSTSSRVYGGCIIFVLGFAAGLDALINPLTRASAFILFAVAASGLYLAYGGLAERIRAEFHEDKFTVSRKHFDKNFTYLEIQTVRLAQGPWAYQAVYLQIKGEKELVVIPRNIRNKKMKLDLHSWLKEKTRRSEDHQM